MKMWWYKIKRTFRYWYLRILRLKSSPESIALGLALGVLVGFWPIIPFQTVVAVALAFLFRSNKIAAALGTWVSNPLNVPFLYYLFYIIGKYFWPVNAKIDFSHLAMKELINTGWDVFMAMCIGGTILGIPASILTYFIFLKLLKAYRQRKLEKKYRRAHQLS
ncbi:hypothetical protein SAMN04488516_11412 [Desulfonauticus submarinus]|uniref:DUF2062 domain-containing protein n=1 Tax=Desulfonauticus submarinus TaxID=206665 RepID=A0A1H0FSK8_9BACT|nr:DUF2062 domain-containing protein [Desulfonauticus submarinus]SDN97636.1 hypothetical protein SAMN04488516_11412 [Desulfonauticus submarinus]